MSDTFIKKLKKRFAVKKVKGGWTIVYDPRKGSFEDPKRLEL